MSSRIYENEPNEICSHFSEEGPEGERCSLTEKCLSFLQSMTAFRLTIFLL